jgi:hypothetical protein
MTFEEYHNKAARTYADYAWKGIRAGQHYSNVLFMVNQKLYHAVPKELDPFYNDEKLGEFLTWVAENWQ